MINRSITAIALLLFAGNTAHARTVTASNSNAPVYCAKSIMIDVRPQKVWEVLSNISNWNQWMPQVSYTKLNGAFVPGTTFDWKTGGMKIHSTLQTIKPDTELGWTGKVYTIYGIHYWSFKEVNGATEVSVSESMQGFLAGMFKRSLNRTLEKDMIQSLALLKKACESSAG